MEVLYANLIQGNVGTLYRAGNHGVTWNMEENTRLWVRRWESALGFAGG